MRSVHNERALSSVIRRHGQSCGVTDTAQMTARPTQSSTAEVSAFSEGLIEFYPRSGLTGVVEIYRICGTEDDVAG